MSEIYTVSENENTEYSYLHTPWTKEIIRKYNCIVIEYLTMMMNSDLIKEIGKTKPVIFCGLSAVIHTFKLVFHFTQNITTTYQLCQKACNHYLEYIEQMNEVTFDTTKLADCKPSNVLDCSEPANHVVGLNHEYIQQFNNNDVIMYVYNKTINNVHLNRIVGENTENNINSASSVILRNVCEITNVLLNWQNTELTIDQRFIICQK